MISVITETSDNKDSKCKPGSLRPGMLAALLAAVGFGLGGALADIPWLRMWLAAASLFFALKCLVLAKTRTDGRTVAELAWVFLFPGLKWCKPLPGNENGFLSLLASGLINLAFGSALLWLIAPVFAATPMLAAWIGMTGLVFVIHFGWFHLATAGWRKAGFDAEPLMMCPVAASSLADFWSRPWNIAFRDAMRLLVFRPVAVRKGSKAATWSVFAISGLLHELVTSLPAAGGWGGPTAYFLIQALGIDLARHLRIRGPVASCVWAFAFLLVPVGLLFHPPFVHRVMLPFFSTIGVLP